MNLRQCIECLFFEDTKREQTQSKKKISDRFGWLFNKNCKMIESFYLQDQLPDLAMQVKILNLKDENNARCHYQEMPKRAIKLKTKVNIDSEDNASENKS